MSIRSTVIKFFIRLTPSFLIIWVANFLLKGIAELLAFNFDVDARTVHLQTRLYGEENTIDVTIEDFALFNDGDAYRFIIHHAHSDRPWLNNLLSRVIGKAWKIPPLPQFSMQLELLAELFNKPKPAALPADSNGDDLDLQRLPEEQQYSVLKGGWLVQ